MPSITFEMEAVDLQTKRTASGADFTQINAKGYIPALVLDNGKIVADGPKDAVIDALRKGRIGAAL